MSANTEIIVNILAIQAQAECLHGQLDEQQGGVHADSQEGEGLLYQAAWYKDGGEEVLSAENRGREEPGAYLKVENIFYHLLTVSLLLLHRSTAAPLSVYTV